MSIEKYYRGSYNVRAQSYTKRFGIGSFSSITLIWGFVGIGDPLTGFGSASVQPSDPTAHPMYVPTT